MDDDKYQKEVLNRLDKIVTLLSVSCAVSIGSLEKTKAEAAIRQVLGNKQSGDAKPELLNDEMQEDYLMAIQQWKAGKSQ